MSRFLGGGYAIGFGAITLWDEESSGLFLPQFGWGYHNRGLQAVAWQWENMQRWTNSGIMSGDPSVPLALFGQDPAVMDYYEPWSLGVSGKTRPYFIRGICKDGSGNILGGAVVFAVRASDNAMVGSVACDDRGVFECPTLDTTAHFVHSFYASGSLAGRSVATLTPTL